MAQTVKKETACIVGDLGFISGLVRKIPERRKWLPTPVFLSRKSHGQRRLADRSLGWQTVGQDRATMFTVLLSLEQQMWIWTAWAHLLFSIANTTVPHGLQLVESTDEKPQIGRN